MAVATGILATPFPGGGLSADATEPAGASSTGASSTGASSTDASSTGTSASGAAQPVVDLGAAAAYSAMASSAMTISAGSHSGLLGASNAVIPVDTQRDLATAYLSLAALPSTALIDGDLAGRTITPGVYRADAALAMTTTLTFDALGDPDAMFIFQIGAALNTTAASRMVLANGARAENIYWQTLGAVTTGAGSTFMGTMVGNAAITTGAGTIVNGRALTKGGAVTAASTYFLDLRAISLTVTALPADGVAVGDTVVFTHRLRNTGTVDLAIGLTPGLPSSSVPTSAVPASGQLLAAGQSLTLTSSYVVRPADATAGTISVASSVTGTSAGDADVTDGFRLAISVIAASGTPIARDDRLVATSGGPAVTFNPTSNDNATGTGSLGIAAVFALPAGRGTVECPTNSCTFTPPNGFTGAVSTTYVVAVDEALRATATITVFIDPPTTTHTGFVASGVATAAVTLGTHSGISTVTTVVATCTAGRPSVTLSWLPSRGATTWLIERRSASGIPGSLFGDWMTLASVPSGTTSYADTVLGEGNHYQWRVRPDRHRWSGAFSSPTELRGQPQAVSASGC